MSTQIFVFRAENILLTVIELEQWRVSMRLIDADKVAKEIA